MDTLYQVWNHTDGLVKEVSLEEYVRHENAAGVHNKYNPLHPAAGSFSGKEESGRVVHRSPQPDMDELIERMQYAG